MARKRRLKAVEVTQRIVLRGNKQTCFYGAKDYKFHSVPKCNEGSGSYASRLPLSAARLRPLTASPTCALLLGQGCCPAPASVSLLSIKC